MRNILIAIVLFISLSFSGCHAQAVKADCKAVEDSIRYKINMFYIDRDSAHLTKAAEILERTDLCDRVKANMVSERTVLYSFQGRYLELYEYIEGLKDSDFPLQYERRMYSLVFYARYLSAMSKSDSSSYYFARASTLVDSYLEVHGFSEKAMYDLYTILVEATGLENAKKQIAARSNKYAGHEEFFRQIEEVSGDDVIQREAKPIEY